MFVRGIQFGKIGKQIQNEKRKNEEEKNNESRKGSAVNCLSSTLAEKKGKRIVLCYNQSVKIRYNRKSYGNIPCIIRSSLVH